MSLLRILFLDQGRAGTDVALGHVRVKHALATGLPELPEPVETGQVSVPAFTRAQRKLVWTYLPLIGVYNFGSLKWHLLRSLRARMIIQRQLRDQALDVVHVTTDQVSLLLGDVQRRIPCVPSLDTTTIDWVRLTHDLGPGDPTPAYLKPIEWLERRALRAAPLAIPWTETVARRVRALAPATRVEVLHPGIDLAEYAPRAGERPPGPFRILFVGGRWRAKGGPDLLEAVRPELGETIELDVVTTEPVEDHPGLRVHRATPGSSVVADLFRRADVLCLPTSVDAVPWVVLEAMASGVPVVSTDVGSIPEMVSDAGRIVPPRNVSALRDALLSLAGDESARDAMGRAGRVRAEALYDARRNTVLLVDLLKEQASAHAAR